MTEELEVLATVCRGLEQGGVPYMISGSMALNYYARPRMTRDIDVVVELAPDDADRLGSILTGEWYVDVEAAREAIAQCAMFNVIYLPYMLKVDLIVRKDTSYRRVEFERRKRGRIGDVEVDIVTAEDLILSKLDWARDSHSERQLDDVRSIVACVPTLDWPYIEHWAADLRLEHLVREVKP